MNQYDATNALDVAPDGSQVQSHFNQGWQGCRSNHVSALRLLAYIALALIKYFDVKVL